MSVGENDVAASRINLELQDHVFLQTLDISTPPGPLLLHFQNGFEYQRWSASRGWARGDQGEGSSEGDMLDTRIGGLTYNIQRSADRTLQEGWISVIICAKA